MITVKQVQTSKQKREFLNFPLKLYRNNPCFVPPLYADEKKIFDKNYVYYETSEAVYFNAYRDGQIVGRISGILQRASNEKNNEKRVRFTRFDCIDDEEVAKALFDAVENFAISKGMDTVCGPLGFSDLEREGLLVEGFDKLSTFEEQYNFEYYGRLIEKCGYAKEVDWLESMIFLPDEGEEEIHKMAQYVLKRYNLHIVTEKSIDKFLKKYADDLFELIDKGYDKLYGTVPFSDGMKKMLISNFKIMLKLRYIIAVANEDGKVVMFGFCMPSIGKALQKSKGHLSPAALIKVLHAINHPEIIDLALVAVDPEYLERGISAVCCDGMVQMLRSPGVKFAETNLNLENNYMIRNLWHRFKSVEHKRRRAYVKTLRS